ncbi:hypothetical protein B0T26DRAFT_743378 [Lasiosphaeria miniovina]|uniref:Nucleotide-diphospho-sugar transferase domain-containing protein n=1 Tax=Lasiosphaeria miniovina TaxID=1954250 RepID=A0AA40A6M6_9PEZI|nr:uncharacterized protein B0T26DRAFT_743378 [Lasiosphaeria miniovina]KAK0710282.1 hypothetical protein B0T26DRAFT_743378 [Lasiosphaeria miniovina]
MPSVPQSWRRLLFLLPVLVIALGLATGLYSGSLPKPKFLECKSNDTNPFHNLHDIIHALWAPLVVPINQPTFTTIDGAEKSLPAPEELTHTEKLGRRLLILDVDTRPLSEEGSVFGESLPTWDNLKNPSAGFLSHYMYSLIHGYSYKFIRAPQYVDRAPHWSKVVLTKEMLKSYDFVIMLDYDAMFPTPELPLEWMFNYWKIDKKVMVAMAEDPNGGDNIDLRDKVNINSGFIIAQASENTQALFKDWAECPSEKRYKDCAQWKLKLFHEQAAFSSHVRYDFLDGKSINTDPGYIRMLPCSEANGIPKVKHIGCWGQLVRHYWGDKSKTNDEFSHNVMSALTPLLARAGFGPGGNVDDFRGKYLDGAEVLDQPPSA